ncbi:MAG: transposase zinc-binding domain-containing protein, partial [Kiritimatiellia bacterium]
WYENVERMLSCGNIREGYYEYQCLSCGATRKVGFTCKSRLCLKCVKSAVDDWLEQVRSVLFEGVVHRQVVLTIPQALRPLVLSDAKFMKAFVDAG